MTQGYTEIGYHFFLNPLYALSQRKKPLYCFYEALSPDDDLDRKIHFSRMSSWMVGSD